MNTSREISYFFKFSDDSSLEFHLNFDEHNNLIVKEPLEIKEWTKLDNFKCSNCPLNSDEFTQCPVAKNLDDVVEKTKNKISYEKVSVQVVTPERTYYKETDTQEGLFSLFGLIMASSGCSHLGWFKPLARFHLPFSDTDETMFRILSLHLVSEYLRSENKDFNCSIDGIKTKYQRVEVVNLDFTNRIKSYGKGKGDADLNAITALDLFAKLFEIEESANFMDLTSYFK